MTTKAIQHGATALPTFDLAATAGQKVVRLPTAAPRAVRQPLTERTRQTVEQMRASWPGQYTAPGIRALRRKTPDELASLVERAISHATERQAIVSGIILDWWTGELRRLRRNEPEANTAAHAAWSADVAEAEEAIARHVAKAGASV